MFHKSIPILVGVSVFGSTCCSFINHKSSSNEYWLAKGLQYYDHITKTYKINLTWFRAFCSDVKSSQSWPSEIEKIPFVKVIGPNNDTAG